MLPLREIFETSAFERRRQKLGVAMDDYAALLDIYAADPGFGQVIRGSGGVRKGRVGKTHGGKSGGYRVFSFFLDRRHPVHLLWIIDRQCEPRAGECAQAVDRRTETGIAPCRMRTSTG